MYVLFSVNSVSSTMSDSFVMVSPVVHLTQGQKKESLFEAAKTGNTYSVQFSG